MELAQRGEKHLLDEVINFRWRYPSEKNAVDHTGIPGVQATERDTIAVAGRRDERVILARFGDRPDSHRREVPCVRFESQPGISRLSH